MKQTYIFTSLLCLTTLLMPGCTSPIGSGDDPSLSTLAINFGTPQADTRAAVNSSADMGNFSVWGGYDGNASNVFNQVTVHSPAGHTMAARDTGFRGRRITSTRCIRQG